VGTPVPDGSLADWRDVSGAFSTSALLCGNGLSVNVWSRFAYWSLFEHARTGGLRLADLALFAETQNFERVLSDLATTIRVNEALGIASERAFERYRSIQRGLGHAIREVHPTRSQIPDSTLEHIRAELARYAWIFSTSYDLLVYWAMGCGGSFDPFLDHFRGGGKLRFDSDRAGVYAGQVPVYFPHRALHLVVGGDGVTWKLRRGAMSTVLDQFGEPIADDAHARPLLVTEGTSRDKLLAIEGNEYLAHALDQLRRQEIPAVVFGASLREEDDHLIAALNEHPERPIAVSMRKAAVRDLRRHQADIYGRLQGGELHFFDAATHPLGDPSLRVA
jgi:hypothetical protein